MAESDLIRGNVDTLILKVLYEGDRYGYDMIKQINARSGGAWEIKQPTLYACLKRLEKQGFIRSYWDASDSNGGRRKYYALTDRGREVFISYKEEFERTRDLFGELISGDDSMLPVDDFSDVEDDSYDVPKRKAPRIKKPVEKKAPEEPPATVTEPVFSPADYGRSNYATVINEPAPAPAPEPQPAPTPIEDKPAVGEFIQQSFFDVAPKPDGAIILDEPEPEPAAKPSDKSSVLDRNISSSDPAAMLRELYESEYDGKDSYSGAKNKSAYEYGNSVNNAPAPAPSSALAPAAPKTVATTSSPAPDHGLPPDVIGGESIARRDYKEILTDLVDRCEVRSAAAQRGETAATEARRFEGVYRTVTELGNEVRIRDHNDSAKAYTHKYYYYSNRLMITHYSAMCAAMFLIGAMLLMTFYTGLKMRLRYDALLYTFSGLLPVMMFIVAVVIFATNPDKKRRINVNFRTSFIIRGALTIQAAVIIYLLNVIWGMPVGFSAEYIPSLVLPCAYALFIPVSELIFMFLLKSERYAVD